jgi:hypothetical protein
MTYQSLYHRNQKRMKVNYIATLTIASILGLGLATGCGNPCAAKPGPEGGTETQANPCAGKENPCAGKANPCAAKENPCAGKANPCAAKENPCAGKTN